MATAEDRRLLRDLADAVAAGKPVALATIVSTRRSVPRHAGTKMLVFGDGGLLGTVGGGAMESRVVAAARAALRTGKPVLLEYSLLDPGDGDPGVCGGEVEIYVEPYLPPHTVLVVGCGHVGAAVVDLAHWLGFRVVATDDRAERVTPEALPQADVLVAGTVAEALRQSPVTEDTSIVLVSRDVDIDVDAIPRLLATPARYLGVMGSTRRWRTVRDRLVADGVDPAALERIHVPIGIELGAETLEEIAVSILAQVIQVTRTAPDDGTPPG